MVGLVEGNKVPFCVPHGLPQLDPALPAALSLADPGVLVAVLSRNIALMFFGRILRLIHRNDGFLIKHFLPGSRKAIAEGAENLHHRHLQLRRHALCCSAASIGDRQFKRLLLPCNGPAN